MVQVDEETYDLLDELTWFESERGQYPPKYVYRVSGDRRPRTVFLHRLVVVLSHRTQLELLKLRWSLKNRIDDLRVETEELPRVRFNDGDRLNCTSENLDATLGPCCRRTTRNKFEEQQYIKSQLLKLEQEKSERLQAEAIEKDKPLVVPDESTQSVQELQRQQQSIKGVLDILKGGEQK